MFIKARSSQTSEEIDLHIYHGQYFDEERGAWILWFSLSLAHAVSRGWVRLTSPDPDTTLEIDHRHLSEPAEVEALCDGVEVITQLVTTPPLAAMIEPLPGPLSVRSTRDERRAEVGSM